MSLRAERVIRPTRAKTRRLRVLVVMVRSPRPIRAVQRARLYAITWTASQAPLAAKRPERHVVFSVNYFQPSFKLLEKTRDGATVIKRYSPPATPCDRLTQGDTITAKTKEELNVYRAGLDPVALLRSIREAQSAMAAMSSPQLQETPHSESIDRFLARLPSLWQQGEARPTHKARVRPPRHWRTRKDPFDGVCCDVLLWLQKDPDTNAKDLLAKLREAYPGRFGDAHLRTLQRRVKDWRGVMAKRLVYSTSDEPASERSEKVELVLVGVGNKG